MKQLSQVTDTSAALRTRGLLPVTAGAGVAAAALAYAWLVERTRVRLDRYVVEVNHPGVPPRGLTILHLSDFHFRAQGWVQARKLARLRRLLSAEQYDLVALTGDLVHDAEGFPPALSLIESLQPRLGTYYVPGNHDYAEYSVWGIFAPASSAATGSGSSALQHLLADIRAMAGFVRKVLRNELVRLPVAFNDVPAMTAQLEMRGVRPLINRNVHLQGADLDLWIAGVDDLLEGRPELEAALAGIPPDAPLLLLAHTPDIWLDPRTERADLILCGHTHGGQIRLPLVGAAHTQGTHLTRRQAWGWFARGRTRMFVTRGLGESIPLRLGVSPQAALIRLVPPGNESPAGRPRVRR